MVDGEPFVLLVETHKPESADAVICVPTGRHKEMTYFPYATPVTLPLHEALRLQTKFNTLRILTQEEFRRRFPDQKAAAVNMRRAEGLGDLLLLTPVIRTLSAKLDYYVDVAVRRDLMWLFEGNPWVRQIRAWDLKGNDRDHYDGSRYFLDIDLDGYSERVAEDRAVNDRTTVFANRFNLTVPEEWKEPYFALTDEMCTLGEKALPEKGGVGIQVLTSHDHRDYPYIEQLALELAARGTRVVMLCHWRPFECPKHENIIDMMGDACTGRTLPGVVNRLDAMIAADSGLMHLALALNVPTVCMFGIISPELRVPNYKTPKEIMYRRDLPCHGCGNKSMNVCKHAGTEGDKACMKFKPSEVINVLDRLPKRADDGKKAEHKRDGGPALKFVGPTARVIRKPRSMWLTFMFQDEPLALMERFIERVCAHDAIERVVAIDGGAPHELRAMVEGSKKIDVYSWPYNRGYWNMQAMQRNHSFDPIPDGTHALYMDPDEEFNDALYAWIPYFPESGIGYGMIARATWDRRHEFETGAQPHGTHDWPDFQPRFFGPWRRAYKFDGAAHHVCLNTPPGQNIPTDRYILHFEEESGKREEREAQWASAMARKRAVIG